MTEQTCDNCSRTGTRGFTTLGGHMVPTPCGPEWLDPIVVCAARQACAQRAYRLTPAWYRAARRWSDECAA